MSSPLAFPITDPEPSPFAELGDLTLGGLPITDPGPSPFVELGDLTLGGLPDFPDRLTLLHSVEMLAEAVRLATGQVDKDVIDPLGLAASFRSTVKFGTLNPGHMTPHDPDWVSAVIVREPGGLPEIAIERDDSPYRRRFSLVHEVAHLLTAPPDALVADARRPLKRPDDDLEYFIKFLREYFADAFTHMFLMPSRVFDPLVAAGKSVEEISSRLRVSRLTVRNRNDYRLLMNAGLAA